MPERFAKRPLRQRIVALVLAYLVALSGVIGTFGAAHAAAAASIDPGFITCHGETSGRQTPAGDKQNGALCDGSCCIGCLMLVAALPPPPAIALGAPQSSGRTLPLLAVTDFAHTPQTRSHQSRAPPIAA